MKNPDVTEQPESTAAGCVQRVVRCRDCAYLERERYIKAIHGTDEMQCGGTCKVLQSALAMDNSSLLFVDAIYIQDSFGCVLGKPKTPNDPALRPGATTEKDTNAK